MVKHFLAACVVAMVGIGAWAGEDVEPIKALLITGGNAHDYKGQIKLLTDGISERINIEWTVEHPTNAAGNEVPGNTMIDIYKKPDWTKGYDIVVHNECYAEVADKDFVESIGKAHAESGVAGVVIHGTLHAYRSADKVTDEWRKFLGVTFRPPRSRRQDAARRNREGRPSDHDWHARQVGGPERGTVRHRQGMAAVRPAGQVQEQ